MAKRKKQRSKMPYGPASDFIIEVLSEFQFYRDYVSGTISRQDYLKALSANSAKVNSLLLNDEHLWFLAREYAPDLDVHALDIFSEIVENGLLFDVESEETDYYPPLVKRIRRRFRHKRNHTFIQPDEAHLLYLISMSKKPLSMIAVGAYYGYWAIWAMPGVYAVGGSAVLIDPNPGVCALAKLNFRKMGFSKITRIFAKKAEDALPKISEQADLVLLDAAGPQDNPNPEYRGKGIYSFLIEPIYEKMASGAFLVVHNDKPSANKAYPLKHFHAFCHDHFRYSFYAHTPEGIGIYVK